MSGTGGWRWPSRRCALAAAVLITAATSEVGSGHTPAGRPPVTVEATVEPTAVTIGTPVRYTLRLTTDELTELIIPSLAGQIGAFQVVDFGGEPPRRVAQVVQEMPHGRASFYS